MFRGPRGRLAMPTELPSLNKEITYLLTYLHVHGAIVVTAVVHVPVPVRVRVTLVFWKSISDHILTNTHQKAFLLGP